MNNNIKSFVIYLLFISCLLTLYGNDVIHFDFIPQVRIFAGRNPFDLIAEGHRWGPRYLVAYPAVKISEWYQLSLDDSYTIYGIFIYLVIIKVCEKTGELLNQNKSLYSIIAFIFVIILSQVMNGRLIPAYLGFAIILYYQIKLFNNKKFLNLFQTLIIFFAFILSTVSSGTMMVVFFQIIVVFIMLFKRYGKINMNTLLSGLLLLWIIFSQILPYVNEMVGKNLAFFGNGIGGVLRMLTHGLGRFFVNQPIILLLITFVMPVLCIIYLVVYRKIYKNIIWFLPIIIAIPISLICGLFGLSTATMVIPPSIIIISYIINTFIYDCFYRRISFLN